jgi:hypothetical protein
MSTVCISRDSFARTELHREIVNAPLNNRGCYWCGGSRSKNGQLLDGLFQYSTESDGGSTNVHKGLFCSKSCHDSYHA